MKKLFAGTLLVVMCVGGLGCTNMSRTQTGVVSGAALGAVGGAGVMAITGGTVGLSALAAGVGAGAVAGGIVGLFSTILP